MLCSRGSHEGIRNDLDQSVNGANARHPQQGSAWFLPATVGSTCLRKVTELRDLGKFLCSNVNSPYIEDRDLRAGYAGRLDHKR
jgi:hypothetical protein